MPPATCATKAATQSADQADRDRDARRRRIPEGERTTFVFWRAHSGQRMPTGVDVMQSGQIGRPQFEQATFVSRSGCR